MSGLAELGNLWHSIQAWLFPMLEDELGELDDQHREFIAVCETCGLHEHLAAYRWVGNGCPPKDRLALCKAFIAKAVWDFPTTSNLIDAVRHRPTLRRLCGWETLGKIPSEATFSRAFAAFAQDELPQSIRQAMLKTHYGNEIAERIISLYDLADAAYDADPIRQMSARLGHVAIIDHNPRRGKKKEFSPAQAIRYRQRSSAERVNSHLHDNHGGRHIRVRGAAKVAAHLSFGLLVIAAEQLLTMLC